MHKDQPTGHAGTEYAGEPSEQDMRRLVALYSSGQLRAAEIRAHELLRAFPGTPVLFNILGATLTGQGKPDQAISTYRKLLKIKPDYAEAHGNMGIAFKALGKLEAAVVSYQDAVKFKPDFAEAHSNLGAIFQQLGRLEEAVASYRRALEIEPEFVEDHNNLGIALDELGRTGEAIESYRKALEIKPGFAGAHYNLGRALQQQGLLDEAIASYQAAIGASPDHTSACVNLGGAFMALGRLDEAIAAYQQAVTIRPDHATAHDNLGSACLQLGQLDAALDSYRQALAVKPDFAEAHRHLANARKHAPDDQEIADMEALYAKAEISPEQKMHLAFGLAKAFDDVSQHEKSFDCLLEGNRLKRETFEFDLSVAEAYFDRLRQVFSAEYFSAPKTPGNMSETPVFILGMPRSGTSLVEQILASHPGIYGARELEDLTALAEEAVTSRGMRLPGGLTELDKPTLDQLAASYLERLKAGGGDALRITDKRPQNFVNVGLITTLFPAARIIHVRREAMDTCFSIFATCFAQQQPYAYDLAEIGTYYRLYEKLMEHWREVLPDAMFEISYEALVDKPEQQIRAMLDHCGLAFDPACLDFHETERPVRTASAWQVRQPLYTDAVGRWRHYEKQLAPLHAALKQ